MTASESQQTREFDKESARFVGAHLGAYPTAPEWVRTSPVLREGPISSVLDVGCGPGLFLEDLVRTLHAERGVGVELSTTAVDLLRDHFSHQRSLEFQRASAHELPFDSDSFDVVVCWSVLHWVGRNEYLQALGELVRVTRRHLIIMDFVGGHPYRVPYAHDERFYTYKTDFVPLVLGSGIMVLREDRRWWDGHSPGSVSPLALEDLEPFPGTELNYHARRGAIFTKDYSALPLHVESDFARVDAPREPITDH